MPDLVILKPTCAVDMHNHRYCFSPRDIAATASAYDPARFAAPLVIGHPASDASSPAHGWIKRLTVDAAGALVATVEQVSATLKTLIKAGSYRHLSASFWPPTHPSNPSPGVFSLRHVGALGASPPAVRGLSDLTSLAFAAPLPWPTCLCASNGDFTAPRGRTLGTDRLLTPDIFTALAARNGRDMLAAARLRS